MAEAEERAERQISTNRKARHEYFILDTFEAGVVLTGTEVKSLRHSGASLADGYADIVNGELWLRGVHISPYEQGSYANVDPVRSRKLLMHRKEIHRLAGRLGQRGITLIPLKLYFKNNVAKVELGVAQGKRAYDKRQDIARREMERSLKRQYAK
jgi:SsrA-binding protein